MQKNIEYIIKQIRRDTQNLSEAIVVSSSEGIQDIDFIRGLNRAQDRLQSIIVGVNLSAFEETKLFDIVANQGEYSLPDDCYLKNKIISLDYSPTGVEQDFYALQQKITRERNNLSTLYLDSYILKNGAILFDPRPQSSVINGGRVNYVQTLPRLDIRRSSVTAVTLDTTNRNITSLFVDVINAPSLTDENLMIFQENNYFSIVDKYGNIKMSRIPYDSFDTGTGEILIPTSFVYQSGMTIDVGDFLVCGYIATTNSVLPDELERYLECFTSRYIFNRDSSDDEITENSELKEIEDDLLVKYAQLDEDVNYVPIVDDSYLL